MDVTSVSEALEYLGRRLAQLELSGQGYRVLINGKGKAITVEVTEIARFDGQTLGGIPSGMQRLEERR